MSEKAKLALIDSKKQSLKEFFNSDNTESPGKCNSKVLREYNYPKVIYYYLPKEAIEQVILDPKAPKYFEQTFIEYCKSR